MAEITQGNINSKLLIWLRLHVVIYVGSYLDFFVIRCTVMAKITQ